MFTDGWAMTSSSARHENAIGSIAIPRTRLNLFTIEPTGVTLKTDRPLQPHFAVGGHDTIGETRMVGFELERRPGIEVEAQAGDRAIVRAPVLLLRKIGVGLVERRLLAAGVRGPAPEGLADLEVARLAPVRAAVPGKIEVVEVVVLGQDFPVALE